MVTLGDLDLSVFSGTQKNALALVSLNFDFSLLKWMAPKEYQDVGEHLAPQRKQDAEEGLLHTVVRKLTVLFFTQEFDVPEVPYLIEAYGKRASFISRDPKFNPKGSHKQHGVFTDFIGVDSTGIWAAATSGPGAIHLHLLACMISYMFKGPEATSIWVELVADRQNRLIKRAQSEECHISEFSAAKIRIERSDLAAWDASTRAWLETADAAHPKQHTQLRLIAQAFVGAVPSGPNVYESVKEAWLVAMRALNEIIQGIPQNVQNAGILLGLLAWHIYPDMYVVTAETKHIVQKDELVRGGGIITLGIQQQSSHGNNDTGISWSLPLSHLRYYSRPVVSKASVEEQSRRVQFSQLLFVAFGGLIRGWTQQPSTITDISMFFVELAAFLQRHLSESRYLQHPVCRSFEVLALASRQLLESTGLALQDAFKLVAFGRRHGAAFVGLDKSENSTPYAFGFSSANTYFNLLKGPVEPKIQWLRENLTSKTVRGVDLNRSIIIYDPKHQYKLKSLGHTPDHDHPGHPDRGFDIKKQHKEFASLVKRHFTVDGRAHYAHQRLIPAFEASGFDEQDLTRQNMTSSSTANPQDLIDAYQHLIPALGVAYDLRTRRDTKPISRKFENAGDLGDSHSTVLANASKRTFIRTTPKYDTSLKVDQQVSQETEQSGPKAPRWAIPGKVTVLTASADRVNKNSTDEQWSLYLGATFQKYPWSTNEDTILLSENLFDRILIPERPLLSSPSACLDQESKEHGCPYKWYLTPQRSAQDCPYNYWFGDLDNIAVYHLVEEGLHAMLESGPPDVSPHIEPLTFTQVSEALKGDSFDPDAVLEHLEDLQKGHLRPVFDSFSVLYDAFEIYKPFLDATVDLHVTSNPLHAAKWAGITDCAAKSFACIAMFEHGNFNAYPHDLVDVTAMSTRSSLYIPEDLLQDPYKKAKNGAMIRIVGNIGKPGLVFLATPHELNIKELSYDTWQQINHDHFDGTVEGNFDATSLHLRLTGNEFPLNIRGMRDQGFYDKEIIVAQAVIQVFDRGAWIADIDLTTKMLDADPQYCLPTLRPKTESFHVHLRELCEHSEAEKGDFSSLPGPIVSIDSWPELLEAPESSAIVRAKGSWTARQAIAAVMAQKNHPLYLAYDSICWRCVMDATSASDGSSPPMKDLPFTVVC